MVTKHALNEFLKYVSTKMGLYSFLLFNHHYCFYRKKKKKSSLLITYTKYVSCFQPKKKQFFSRIECMINCFEGI